MKPVGRLLCWLLRRHRFPEGVEGIAKGPFRHVIPINCRRCGGSFRALDALRLIRGRS